MTDTWHPLRLRRIPPESGLTHILTIGSITLHIRNWTRTEDGATAEAQSDAEMDDIERQLAEAVRG